MRWMVVLLTARCALACTVVEGDRITGADLARADAAYSALPADAFVALAPNPGVQRSMDAGSLAAVGRRYGVTAAAGPVCFERRAIALTKERLQPVLEAALGKDIRLEILEFSRYAVPPGDIEFVDRELARPRAGHEEEPVVWRGRVRYGPRSMTIWAKVRVLKFERWIEAVSGIRAHTAITAQQVAVKSGWRFPFEHAPLTDANELEGKQAARTIAAGQAIVPAMLEAPLEVEHGDTVEIEVVSAGVSLRLPGRAETSGRRNDRVLVTSQAGKRLRAEVIAKGKVIIHADQSGSRTARRVVDVQSSDGGQETGDSAAAVAAGPVSQ